MIEELLEPKLELSMFIMLHPPRFVIPTSCHPAPPFNNNPLVIVSVLHHYSYAEDVYIINAFITSAMIRGI